MLIQLVELYNVPTEVWPVCQITDIYTSTWVCQTFPGLARLGWSGVNAVGNNLGCKVVENPKTTAPIGWIFQPHFSTMHQHLVNLIAPGRWGHDAPSRAQQPRDPRSQGGQGWRCLIRRCPGCTRINSRTGKRGSWGEWHTIGVWPAG